MKRISNLYEKIISYDNLKRAINEVNKTHRWRSYPYKPNMTTLWVEKTKEERIKELKEIIENGFVSSPCICKRRYDNNANKWRDINEPALWPDQYVHHALIQVLEATLMRGMDPWCCGSIKKRGMHYGIKGIQKWMKSDTRNTRICIEADIKHFYDSIEPKYIMARMKQLIKDYRTLDLIERIISDGIKIGYYTSQWFANTLLQPLDHLIREQAGARYYVRYIDNFTAFTRDQRSAKKMLKMIGVWLGKHGLALKSNMRYFKIPMIMSRNKVNKGIRLPNALGYRYGRGFTLLRKHTQLKLKRELKKFYFMYDSGIYVKPRFVMGLLSRLGMLKHCDCNHLIKKNIRKKTIKALKMIVKNYQQSINIRWEDYLYFGMV